MQIVYLLLLSVVSACFYRMGGCGPADLQKEWGWLPKFITAFPKKRDVVCPIVTLGGAYLAGISAPWWMWVLWFGLMWGALSTYWDFLFHDHDNHYMHGFMIGVALLPLCSLAMLVPLLVIPVVLGVLMGLWSGFLGNATWEELGRGFLMPAVLSLAVLL